MAKLEILNPSEQANFDSPPEFDETERDKFFNLSFEIRDWLESLNSSTNKVGFIMLWGYFQASNRFFKPSQFR